VCNRVIGGSGHRVIGRNSQQAMRSVW